MNSYGTSPLAQTDAIADRALGIDAANLFEPKTQEGNGNRRLLETALALLNHTQAELDQSKRQIDSLKKRVGLLEEAMTSDVLTGLKNRRGFEEAFEAELDRLKRGNSMGGVLLVIDMDNFKSINDTFGHSAGDSCLKLVGQVLKHEIRDMDTAARLGGDEFVVLITNTTSEAMLDRIQSLIWKLNNLSVVWETVEIPISASIGMKPYNKGSRAAEIFSAADQDMYSNKQRTKDGATTASQ